MLSHGTRAGSNVSAQDEGTVSVLFSAQTILSTYNLISAFENGCSDLSNFYYLSVFSIHCCFASQTPLQKGRKTRKAEISCPLPLKSKEEQITIHDLTVISFGSEHQGLWF